MRARKRPVPGFLAALARIIVLLLPMAIVLWWFLWRGRPKEEQAVRTEVEATPSRPDTPAPGPEPTPAPHGPPASGPRVTPAPGPQTTPPPRGAPDSGARPRAAPPQREETRRRGIPTFGIAGIERRIRDRLSAIQPRTAPIPGPVTVTLSDVAWTGPQGRPFFRARTITGLLDLQAAATTGDVLISDLVALDPRLVLERRAGEDRWNYQVALAGILEPTVPARPPGDRRLIALRNVTIENGAVVVRTETTAIDFNDVDAKVARALLTGPGIREPVIDVARLSTALRLPDRDIAFRGTIETGTFRLPDGRLLFDVDRIAAGSSVLVDAVGEYVFDSPGLGIDASVRAERLMFEDLSPFAPNLPPEGDATFALRIELGAEGSTLLRFRDLVARSGGSRVAGTLETSIGGPVGFELLAIDLSLEPLTIALLESVTGPLPYGGALRGRITGTPAALSFNIVGNLTAPDVAEPFRATLQGTATLEGPGFAIRTLDVNFESVPLAVLRPLVPGLSMTGLISGTISLRGPPNRVPLQVDVRLVVAAGAITLAGTIDLRGAVPAYDLTGRLIGVRLQELFEPELPPVALTANYAVVGRGTNLGTAALSLELSGIFSGWVAAPRDGVRIRARLEAGTANVDAATLSLAGLSLATSGTWRYTTPPMGGLDYALTVRSISVFAPYIPPLRDTQVGGTLRTTGLLSGTLDRPIFTGDLQGDTLRYAGWRARALTGEYELALGDPIPGIRTRLTARDLTSPDGDYATAVAEILVDEPIFDFDLTAERIDGAPVTISGNGWIAADTVNEARFRDLAIVADEQRWALERPATIQWGGPEPGVLVQGFAFRQIEGEGMVVIDGRLPPAPEEGLRMTVAAVPVAPILVFLGREPVVTGDLWVDLLMTGPAASPTIRGDFRLEGGSFRNVVVTRLDGTIFADGRQLDADVIAVLDTAGTMAINASIPLALDLTDGFRADLVGDQPIRSTFVADSLSLGVIAASTAELRDATGTLRTRLEVMGTPDAPRLTGFVRIDDGAATIVALDQRYEQISADIVVEDRVATIRDLRAGSDGWAVATGTVTFTSLTNPALDLAIDFDEFRAIGVDDLEPAAAWGQLSITGNLNAPVVTGDITMNDGNVAIPSTGARDELADFGGIPVPGAPVDELEPLDRGTEQPSIQPVPWFERLSLDDLILEAGDNLWFVTEQVRIQLSGELVLVKMGGESLRIFGTLEGDRGTFTLRVGPLVRRFTIIDATIRFLGLEEINPSLDVTASKAIISPTGQPTEILLHIEGTLNAPTVAVTTPEGATVPETELLSVLIFGTPGYSTEEGRLLGQTVLEEALFGIGSLAELATIGLEETLVEDLGLPLDYLQIIPSPGPYAGFGTPTIIFGREIAEDVFLTVDWGLGAFIGPETAPTNVWAFRLEWRIDPQWTLELGFVPVNRGLVYRGTVTALPATGIGQQFIVELRRRWTY